MDSNTNHIEFKVVELRKEGLGYQTIANKLGLNKDKVRYLCRKNNLNGFIADNPLVYDAFARFIEGFNTKHGDSFLYLSGFKGSESPVLIQCKKCGYEFTRSAQIARKNKVLTCIQCKSLNKAFKDREKESQRTEREIKKQLEKQHRIQMKQLERERRLVIECYECGNSFKAERQGVKYCSEECKSKHNNRVRELNRRKKIKTNGNVQWDITLSKLIKRDNNVCHICGGSCDNKDYSTNQGGHFIVGNNYPSIDHVVPISIGGTHTWDNVKLAHHYCNTIKSNKSLYEDDTKQLSFYI